MNHAASNEPAVSAVGIKLKVAEAMTKDAGRAYARISPEDMVAMDAAIGDIVEISGKRKTVCKLMPAHAESRGKSSVQMDGVSRESAGAGLGELASIRKVACRIADEVTLGLAPTIAQQVLAILRELREDGLSILMVEEKAVNVVGLADFGAFLSLGIVSMAGPMSELTEEVQAAAYLGSGQSS